MQQLRKSQPLHRLDGDFSRLKAYIRDKQTVARQVRAVERLLKQHNVEDRADVCHELMVKLAEDRFTLAVVGQFKRGKSSLMNAIIGRELLPTGILPITSAITILRFGPRERLVISRENWSFDEEAAVSALPNYVTEMGNPGNQRRVKSVYVEFPSPFLRHGLEFVDTPGIGGPVEANTATTDRFIPECDAILFVTSADGPLAATETEFLDRIRQHVRKIFFVVNKIDLLTPAERGDVLRFISENLSRQLGAQQVRLFPVSARLALAAKTAQDMLGLVQSGVLAVGTALAEFLANQRSGTFLATILDRAEELLTAAPEDEAIERREAIEQLRSSILSGEIAPTTAPHPLPAPDRLGPLPPKPAEPLKPIQESELISGLAARGCSVCKHLSQVLFDFFAKWQYSLSSDEATQQSFAAERGFCPLHTWQLAAISSPKGLSLAYPALLDRLSANLSEIAADADGSSDAVANLIGRSATCRACCLLADTERDYTLRLADLLATASGREAYARSQGVCLRHLAPLVAAVQEDDICRFLLGEAARHFDELVEDMQCFALKQDATRRYLQNSDEADAYLRALIQVAGQKSLCFPWRLDEGTC